MVDSPLVAVDARSTRGPALGRRGARRPRALACALLLACVTLPATQASAASRAEEDADDEVAPASVVILPIVTVEGELDDAARGQLAGKLRDGLARGGFTIVDGDEVAKLAADGCPEGQCSQEARDQLREAGATHALRARVSVRSRDYTLELELLDLETGEPLIDSSERCEICGLGEVADLLEMQSARLQAQYQTLGKGPPVLAIASKPSGALVFVDDKLVGKTPLELPTTEGAHKVRLSLNGYAGVEESIEVSAGEREALDLTLKPNALDRKLLIGGGVTLGTGLALLGGGFVLLGFDDRPVSSRCGPEVVDKDGDCPFVYNTHWPGAALAVTGAAAVTVGIVLLLRHRALVKQQKAALQAGVTPGGFVIQGRF
ncbi:MAG: PEGA domain-containing protein [Myxococcales bacterium]|nr:PEGA domain-containing protein [Myxococcales bacterium]